MGIFLESLSKFVQFIKDLDIKKMIINLFKVLTLLIILLIIIQHVFCWLASVCKQLIDEIKSATHDIKKCGEDFEEVSNADKKKSSNKDKKIASHKSETNI